MLKQILAYFDEIAFIPRCSGNEASIRDFLVNWATNKGLDTKVDGVGNLVIYVPATQDKIDSDVIIIQSHMDMVCVKSPDSNHNFETDPIKVLEKDGYLIANGTSLGSDNGIGMAMMICAAELQSHPALELFFTIEEETGLKGASEFDVNMFDGKRCLNLDSEDEGEITISAAGGAGIVINKVFDVDVSSMAQYKIQIKGGKGGHSGVDIDKKRGNMIYLTLLYLQKLIEQNIKFELLGIKGGFAGNAIPTDCELLIGFEETSLASKILDDFIQDYKTDFDCPALEYEINTIDEELSCIQDKELLINTVLNLKDGVYKISEKIVDLVQTSNNLGVIKLNNGKFEIETFLRSSDMEEMDKHLELIKENFVGNGFGFNIDHKFPGYQQDPNSDLIQEIYKHMKEIMGEKAKLNAVHAGLECGIIAEKIGKDAQVCSFGPTIIDPHSIDERCEISSIESTWKVLEGFLSK